MRAFCRKDAASATPARFSHSSDEILAERPSVNPVVFHIASGDSFFSGVAFLLASFALAQNSRSVLNRFTAVTFVVGVVAIAVSSTAIPYWIYSVASLATVVWMASRYIASWQKWAGIVVSVVWIAAVLVELPWHFTPEIDSVPRRSITIIGDSVTAGVGSDETSERWPQILEQEHSIAVLDISHVGETAAAALKRVRGYEINSPIIIVEIGGNDLLGGSPSAGQFAGDLDALLDHVTTSDRQVVMFELPLPPFHNEYGRIQRLAAEQHNVQLIPRRRFLSVLAVGDATLDTIHLSQTGHRRMADCVWSVIHSAFSPDPLWLPANVDLVRL